MTHTFNPAKVKPEPLEFVDYDDPDYATEDPYFAVPWAPDAPFAPGALEPTTTQVTTEEKTREYEQIVAEQKSLIDLNPPDEQAMIYTAIDQKLKHVNAKVPWTKNFPEARSTNKWQQMMLEIRRQAILEHQDRMQSRRNPKRSATTNLRAGVYNDQDNGDIEFLGCYDKNGAKKKLVRKRKPQKK